MKYYYIKVEEYINDEWKNYGYFEKLIITGHYQNKPEINIDTVSDKQYAKKYKSKTWANKMIKNILDQTKDNVFLYRDDKYVYRFNIVEE